MTPSPDSHMGLVAFSPDWGKGQEKEVPQSKPQWAEQIQNSAGGYVWRVDSYRRLRRFLILGIEGGSYYATERELLIENARAVLECFNHDAALLDNGDKQSGFRTVEEIVSISDQGLALKNDPALFALAIGASHPNDAIRRQALASLPHVARIGTHLFHFFAYVKLMRGMGRGLREALAKWYTSRSPDSLALQLVKYQSRDGVSHVDILRLAHPSPKDVTPEQDAALGWAAGNVRFQLGQVDDPGHVWMRYAWNDEIKEARPVSTVSVMPPLITAFEQAKLIEDETVMVEHVQRHKLQREMIPTQWLNNVNVQRALLPNMGLEAVLRNLGGFTATGVFNDEASQEHVISLLSDQDAIRKSRIHPLRALIAYHIYGMGRGLKGSLTWTVNKRLHRAVEGLFYAAFPNVMATGKRYYLGVDVSGSMSDQLITMGNMSCRELSAAMMMVTYRTEPVCVIKGFSHELVTLPLSADDTLRHVINSISGIRFGGTDCALPMIDATLHRIPIDVFVIYTDNETWYGKIHPAQALQTYRESMGIAAKCIVVSMVANEFSIANPNDPDMLDVVGASADLPEVIRTFSLE